MPHSVIRRRDSLLAGVLLLVLMAPAPRGVVAAPPPRSEGYYNLPLFLWPLDDEYRSIGNYPDTEWTWDALGLTPGMGCPPFRQRDYEVSRPYWRNPELPEDQDWAQASGGHRKLACYQRHAGTDIIALSGAPVYAVADGVVERIASGSDSEGEDGRVEILHQRVYRGQTYTWRGRYLHLKNVFPIQEGAVRAGQLIGFVAFRGANTHLHFEVESLWPDCAEGCVTNPWGPDVLWIDYDDDARIDPANRALPPAPLLDNLVENGGFSAGLTGWSASPGLSWRLQNGVLHAYRPGDAPGLATFQQAIPSLIESGTPLEITLDLGNSSAATKVAGVGVRGPQSWVGAVGCVFAIPPSTPLRRYTVRGETAERWRNMLIQIAITPADDQPALTLDNLRIELLPGAPGHVQPLECLPPGG